MESSMLNCVDSVCVKAEPCEAVYINDVSNENLPIKAEPSSDVSVKLECLSEYEYDDQVGVSAAAAAAELYADHNVKDELVLGPETVERRGVPQISTASKPAGEINQSLSRIVGQQPVMKDCYVRLERIVVDALLTWGTEASVKGVVIPKPNGGQTHQEISSGKFIIYQCAHCRYSTDRKLCLRSHLRDKHPHVKPYTCDQCSYATTVMRNLKNHKRGHTCENCYTCDQCAYTTWSKYHFQNHMRAHTELKLYKCGQCSYASTDRLNLLVHKRVNTGDKPYKCEEWCYDGASEMDLKYILINIGGKIYKCDKCSYVSGDKGDFLIHKMTHTKVKNYKCDQCPFVTANRYYFRKHKKKHTSGIAKFKHKRTHAGDKPYKCDYCSYASSDTGALLKHKQEHTSDKPYKCDHCSYASSDEGAFLKHKKEHTSDKPYKCDHCSYASSDEGALFIHKREHTGDKLYNCDLCSYATPIKKYMESHKINHAGAKPYKCDHCSYASVNKGAFFRHTVIHTSEKPFQCGHCDYASKRKDMLKRHEKTHKVNVFMDSLTKTEMKFLNSIRHKMGNGNGNTDMKTPSRSHEGTGRLLEPAKPVHLPEDLQDSSDTLRVKVPTKVYGRRRTSTKDSKGQSAANSLTLA